eukprot:NODE_41_length_29768_cov_0.533924.p19 type:complete len:125 gc:universal NODE_41_length_29768_cov_0.533924:28355-28729(+)
MQFSSESEDDMQAVVGTTIFRKEVNIEKELKAAQVPKPILSKAVAPKEQRAHYLIEAANRRAQDKAHIMADQLSKTREDDTPVQLYRKPEPAPVTKKRNTSTRDEAIQSYKARSKKRQKLQDVL